MTDTDKEQASETQREFAIQRIYIKDVSYEAPNTPIIFNGEWKPESSLNLNSETRQVGDDSYEVDQGYQVIGRMTNVNGQRVTITEYWDGDWKFFDVKVDGRSVFDSEDRGDAIVVARQHMGRCFS